MERIAGLPKRRDPRGWLPWILSAVFHLEVAYFGAGLVREQAELEAQKPASSPPLEIELEGSGLVAADGDHLPSMSARSLFDPPPRGGEVTPRPDDGRRGRAGEHGGDMAVNLAPTDDGAHLTRTWASRVDRAQELRQRRNPGDRRSPEDDVVTPSPMILTFLVQGPTRQHELMPDQERLARPGQAPVPIQTRTAAFSSRDVGVRTRPAITPAHRGYAGRTGASGQRGRVERAPSFASPAALQGRIAARTKALGEARDDVDSEQEVALRDPSLLAASAAGGDGSDGRGGEEGAGEATGSGGEKGAGASSRAQGDGDRGAAGRDASDRRRTLYIRRVQWAIFNAWGPDDFPASARAAGRGGSTIVSFTIRRNGSIAGLRTVRPSGFPSFDAAIVRAVRSVAPFPPLPEVLGVERLTLPYEAIATNPAVQ